MSNARRGLLAYPEPPPQVRDLPAACRPRELAEQYGVGAVEDYALLAIVLQSGTHGRSVVDMARDLLRRFGSLHGIAQAAAEDLRGVPGIGPVRAQVLQAAFELARRLARQALPDATPVRTPEDAARVLREEVRLLDREQFWILNLDAKNRLKGPPVRVSEGTLDASLVHPREVFRAAIRCGAAAVVLVHNHPSGDPAPSAEDARVTRELVEAGRALRLRVLDHVILGRRTAEREKDFLSLRENGMVSFSD
jgi:DNA repair protein RadC